MIRSNFKFGSASICSACSPSRATCSLYATGHVANNCCTRSGYRPKDIPVVVFTVSWRQTDREFALALGASEYIRKPIDLQAFTDAVCGIINRWAGRKHNDAVVSS